MESLSSKIYYYYSWKINIRTIDNSVARNVYFDSTMIKIPFFNRLSMIFSLQFCKLFVTAGCKYHFRIFKGLIKFY